MSDVRKILSSSFLENRSDVFVAVGVLFFVMMLIIPLPTVVLDILMALNLMLSLVVILIVLYTHRALDFSVFPTLYWPHFPISDLTR